MVNLAGWFLLGNTRRSVTTATGLSNPAAGGDSGQ